MSELTPQERGFAHIGNEVIQIGAVILDENFKFVDDFQIFVKPKYSHVDSFISNLTGISEDDLENAADFVTGFDKYVDWILSVTKDAKFITYCWSNKDYSQLKDELFLKAKERKDLSENLNTFVDLQRTFGEVLGTKISIGLETAVKFCHENFSGQAHTALSDAFNTAIILHKLSLGDFNPQFHYHNDSESKQTEEEKKAEADLQESYKSSMATFCSPELLEKFGIKTSQEDKKEKPLHDDYSNYLPPKMSKREKKLLKIQQKEQKKLNRLSPEIQSQISNHHPTLKYHISPIDWMNFYVKMMYLRANIK